MNIFFLDENPVFAAQAMTNKHVVKMILESAQMMCSAHREIDKRDDEFLYKSTHKNHPSTKWVMESKQNYEWLYKHFIALNTEYTNRFKKVHKTFTVLGDFLANSPINIPNIGLTKFACAMPIQYVEENVVRAYRKYYESEKLKTELDKMRYLYKVYLRKEK